MKASLLILILLLSFTTALAQDNVNEESKTSGGLKDTQSSPITGSDEESEIVLGMDSTEEDNTDFDSSTEKYAVGDVSTSQCTGHVSIGDPEAVENSPKQQKKNKPQINSQQQ